MMTQNEKDRLWRIIAAAFLFAAALAFFRFWAPGPAWLKPAAFLAVYALIGGDILWRALRNIARGRIFDENFLMSLATVGAFFLGEYPEAVAVMLFYQVGELFQSCAVSRSRRSITALMDIRPDYANLARDGGLVRVSPEEVRAGELIAVKSGEKIPLDGTVEEGESSLDTSALTGESAPRDVAPGDDVLSGCVNLTGLLYVRVGKEYGQSTVAKILELVEKAADKKSRSEAFITRFARYYTPFVVFAAAALAIIPPLVTGMPFSVWAARALVFLVISCPCALVISVPLSFFAGIGGASKNGILVKGSSYLELLSKTGTVVFDKTGTLTKGNFAVSEKRPAGMSEEELLRLAAHAEDFSNHPIAASIREAYGKPVEREALGGVEEIAGHGVRAIVGGEEVLAGNGRLMKSRGIPVSAEGDAEAGGAGAAGTVVHLARNGIYAGRLVITDEIKSDAEAAIAKLKSAGIKQTVMLTGDADAVGREVAKKLGLDAAYTELLPSGKVEQLEKLMEEYSGVLAFVGDGINDAPVLARADIGIAMGGLGSDAAIEAADVVLMTDEPSKIAEAIRISRKTLAIVRENIVFSLGVKGIVLVLGALGLANMWWAVFADVGVAVIAILNAMRALRA
jgi:Cd2+/Zn2+-exporting ATPase